MANQKYESTSATLLVRIRSGEAQAWERLTRLYAPLVRHWCKRWGVPQAELDDIVQEIWVAMGPTLARYQDGADRTFRAWIRGISRHKAQDWHRKHAKKLADAGGGTVALQFLHQLESDEEPADDSDEKTQKQMLYSRALSEIRDEFECRTWRIFLAAAVDGKPVADVSTEFGLTTAAVRKIKSRVLHRLREELGEFLD